MEEATVHRSRPAPGPWFRRSCRARSLPDRRAAMSFSRAAMSSSAASQVTGSKRPAALGADALQRLQQRARGGSCARCSARPWCRARRASVGCAGLPCSLMAPPSSTVTSTRRCRGSRAGRRRGRSCGSSPNYCTARHAVARSGTCASRGSSARRVALVDRGPRPRGCARRGRRSGSRRRRRRPGSQPGRSPRLRGMPGRGARHARLARRRA